MYIGGKIDKCEPWTCRTFGVVRTFFEAKLLYRGYLRRFSRVTVGPLRTLFLEISMRVVSFYQEVSLRPRVLVTRTNLFSVRHTQSALSM